MDSAGELRDAKATVKEDKDELSEEKSSEIKQLSVQTNRDMDKDYRVGGAAAVAVGGALGIFPGEVWMKILDELVESKDILNVLRAFPELDKLSQSQKASWLFGLVLPHLMSKHLVQEAGGRRLWIHSQELLKLRLVSKRWKNAVEMSLENHADRHCLLPRGNNAELEPNVVTIPESHYNYHRMWECRLGPSIFCKTQDINNFLGEMGNHRGNPFPGKSVLLQIWHNSSEAVASCVTLLERFGEHVLDFEIKYKGYGAPIADLEVCRNILRCLKRVPNLRSLIFTGPLFCVTDLKTNNFFGIPERQLLFPKLVNLKRFEWRVRVDGKSTWVTLMLETYGKKDGLRKLGIPLDLFSTLNLASHPSIHLTELHVFLDDDLDREFARIENLVEMLPNHQEIREFCLSSLVVPFEIKRVYIHKLIRVLAKFKFESVILEDLQLYEVRPIPEARIPAATITSLVLKEKLTLGLTYDFLRLLPNLKLLTVYVSCSNRMKYRADANNCHLPVESLNKMLRRYFLKAYDPTLEIPENGCIWKRIPSLEMLNVAMQVSKSEVNMVSVQFLREYGNKAFLGSRPDVVEWEERCSVNEDED